MPKDTFLNLDETKRKKILDAAIKEFSRASFEKASIGNIINEAGIPRGSFYQYFNDKEDVYKYVIGVVLKEKHISILKELERSNGEIFEAFEKIFKSELEIFSNSVFRNLMKNFVVGAKAGIHDEVMMKRIHDSHGKRQILGESGYDGHKKILDLINRDLYSIKDDDSFIILINILSKITNSILFISEIKNMSEDRTLRNFKEIINILKYGALKKESQEMPGNE